MAITSALLASSLLLAPLAAAQSYTPGERSGDAFEWIQPLNTTIYGQYDHSPAVLPSRESSQAQP